MAENNQQNIFEQFLKFFQRLSDAKDMETLEDVFRDVRKFLNDNQNKQIIYLKEMRPYLLQALQHSLPQFNEFGIQQISYCIENPSGFDVLSDEKIIQALISLLSDMKKTGCAEKVIHLFVKVKKSKNQNERNDSWMMTRNFIQKI